VTHCTPFRFLIGPVSIMAEILSRLALMLRSDTTKAEEHAPWNPERHFSGFRFTLCCCSFAKTLVRSGTRSPVFFNLTTMSSTYASMMWPIDSPKCVACIIGKLRLHFETKGPRLIAVCVEWSNE
jgi:hypothetical protein